MRCEFGAGPDWTAPERAAALYRVDQACVLRGPAQRLPEAGWLAARFEGSTLDAPWSLGGEVRGAMYSDPAAPYAAANGLPALPFPPGPVRAVLIPLGKSPEWWAMREEERRVYFHPAPRDRHIEIGVPFTGQIHRRLFHCREEGSAYDFVTYFEFAPEHTEAFQALCAGLRDVRRNPEWQFVDREAEIWMTRTA